MAYNKWVFLFQSDLDMLPFVVNVYDRHPDSLHFNLDPFNDNDDSDHCDAL